MRLFKGTLVCAAVLALAAPVRAHEDGDDEGGGRFNAALVPADASLGGGLGRIKIEAQDSGEVKMEAGGLTDALGNLLSGPAAAELKISGNLNGAPSTPIDVPLDVVDGRAAFRGSLGLNVGDTFEIVSVQLIVTGGATLVPGLGGGSGDGDDQGEDGDGDHGGDGDHQDLTRDDDGEGGGYAAILVKKIGSPGFDFDSAGGAHVSISDAGRVNFAANGVIDPANANAPVDANCDLIISSAAGVFLDLPVTLTGGNGEASGTLPLTAGRFPDISSVTLGCPDIFAVVGVKDRGDHDDDGENDDGDDDGVPDSGDDCSGTQVGAPTTGSGCSLKQLCTCTSTRAEFKACVKTARTAIVTRVRATCTSKKACRKLNRRLAIQKRQLLRTCH